MLNLKRCAVGLGLIGLVLTGTPVRAGSQQVYLQCLTNFEAYAETMQCRFEASTNLVNWGQVTPSRLVIIGNLPDAYVRRAAFPAPDAAAYVRMSFSVHSGP